MEIIKSIYRIDEAEAKTANIPKDYILRNLTYSLAEKIMKMKKVPIPHCRDGIIEYSIISYVCDEQQGRSLANKLKELKYFKEMASGTQCLVDRRMKEDLIEELIRYK